MIKSKFFQLGLLTLSLTLALTFIQTLPSWWPFETAQIAEIAEPGYIPSTLQFSPDELPLTQAGSSNSKTVDIFLSQPQNAPNAEGFTLSLNYDQSLITITNIEPISPFTQALGSIDYTQSPIKFSFVKPLNVLGETSSTTMCAMDVFTCPDGTQVGRTPPSCSFICPGDDGYIPRSPRPMPTREPLPPIISCDPEPRHICYDGTEVALSGYIDKNGEVRCDFVCGKPTPPAPSTPPNGCYYQEVQCIKTPCEPILVCPTPTTPPQPQILKNTPLIRLTFHLNNLPASEGLVQSSISFAETSVVSSEVDSSIVDFGAELRLNISKTPPPTADPGTSISCRPAVFKLPFTKDSPEYQDIISGNNTFLGQMHMNNRINEEDNYVTVKAGDLLLYVPEITNTSSQYISTMTDQGLLFTMSGVNESPEYQYLIYPSSRCTLDSSGRKGECREDISIEPGVTKMLNSSHLVTEIRPGSSGATSFYQFTFNRQDCGLFRTEMSSPKEGDLNGDGNVDLFDYQELITNFGNPWTIFDYQKIIANYGN